jgi:hypothetical protein
LCFRLAVVVVVVTSIIIIADNVAARWCVRTRRREHLWRGTPCSCKAPTWQLRDASRPSPPAMRAALER